MHSHAAHEDPEELGLSNQSPNRTFDSIFHSYISRRALLRGAVASLVLSYATPLRPSNATATASGFTPLTHSTEDKLLVPPGYDYRVIIRWGDPGLADTPAFDPTSQTPAKQARQFGHNADFIGFLPLPAGSQNADRGLLVVNHEYVNPELMFAEWDGTLAAKTRKMVDIEMAAHGLAVVEIQRDSKAAWSVGRHSGS